MVADTEKGVSTDGGEVAERSKTQQHLSALRATWPLVRAQLLEPTFIAMSWVLFVGPLSHAVLEAVGLATPLPAGESAAGHMWFVLALVFARAVLMALSALRVGRWASMAAMLALGLLACPLWPRAEAERHVADGRLHSASIGLWHRALRPQVVSLCYWYGAGYLLGDDVERALAAVRRARWSRPCAIIGLLALAGIGAAYVPLGYMKSGSVVPYSLLEHPERLAAVLLVDVPFMAACIVLWLVALPNEPVLLWTSLGRATLTCFLWHQTLLTVVKAPRVGLMAAIARVQPPALGMLLAMVAPAATYVLLAAPFMLQRRVSEPTFALWTAGTFAAAGSLLWLVAHLKFPMQSG